MQPGTLARTNKAGAGGVSRRFLNERELAEYSGIAVRTLQRWRLYPDQGPPYKKLGGAVRYDIESFHKWVEACPGGGQA
jgi:hypothetical protein